MSIRPCVVIPCYNHGKALTSFLSDLERYNLPVVVVDDGSSDDTKELLDDSSSRFSWMAVVHRPHNGGKGAAVRDGLAWATDRGYSHALLLDGDGQHALEDIPRFLATATRSPEAIILGCPLFDDDAPLIRRCGREVSNLFAALITARFAARDVLCGFRVYPLAPLRNACDLTRLQPRMGFDVEIIVRALWGGMAVVNEPTRVSYPRGGISHFRYGKDNLQLAWLYSGLACEGLYKVPRRCLRKRFPARKEDGQWHQMAERGTVSGLRSLLRVLEWAGRVPLKILLVPITLHMFVWGGSARTAAIEFQRHIASLKREPVTAVSLLRRSFFQFWEFGVSIVEKIVSWREGIPFERFTWIGRDQVKARLACGRGAIFMGAHVGNVEVIRALSDSRNVVVNALMFTANSRHFRKVLEEVNTNSFLRVIDVSSIDPSIVFELQERLDRGEIVALLADRAPKHSEKRVVEVPFLGRIARFPEGPWILTSLLDAPVYSVFSMRERGGRYRVEFKLFADRIELPRARRRESLERYVTEFSTRLGEIVLRYPYQWFNFYPFWVADPEQGAVRKLSPKAAVKAPLKVESVR